jgi:hypothetical protein
MTASKKISAIAAAAAVAALSAVPADGHHSTAAFDNTRVVKLEGTITQFRWINPHASIKIDGVTAGDDPDGAERAAQRRLDTYRAQAGRQGHDVREPAAQ